MSASTVRRASPDDTRLRAALRARGRSVTVVPWDDPGVDWGRFRLLIVRSTWNYHRQRPRFLRWARRVSRRSQLWNPYPTLRRNTDKTYLRSLARRGIPVVPTRWVQAGGRLDLARMFRREGWARCVVKPTVSANAFHTFVVDRTSRTRDQARVDRHLRHEALMVQPYLPSVEREGERSLIFLDGRFSHAVLRAAVLAGGHLTLRPPTVRPTPEQIRLARAALAAEPFPTLYARVDLLRDLAGNWCVGELELTEPFLFLGSRRGAAQRLARAIDRRLRS